MRDLLPDPWEGFEASSTFADQAPQVDPHSAHGHIVVGVNYLRSRFRGGGSETLRNNLQGEAPNRQRYWFRDTAAVRRELGMEEAK